MGTLDRYLKNIRGISKAGHESGEARGGTQLDSFMTSSLGGGMPFSYSRDRMIEHFTTYVTLDELPFYHGESENLEYKVRNLINSTVNRGIWASTMFEIRSWNQDLDGGSLTECDG